MESFHISILESFPLISITMPFYGYSDEIFRLISSLSVKARKNLIDYYPEFRKFMFKYSRIKKITIRTLVERKIPMDLFKLDVDKSCLDAGVNDLIVLISTLY